MHPLLSELTNYDHIIWDWNGTLLGDLTHNVRTMNALLDSAALPQITIDDHRKYFRFPVVDYYEILGFDTCPDSFILLCEEFNSRYNEGIANCELSPGIREVLLQLKVVNKTQSILSASKQDALENAVKHFELSDVFQYVFGIEDNMASSKLERGKQLMELSHIPSEATVLVGDTTHDLEVGNALGIDVILVDHGHQSIERLLAAHDRVIHCF
jgi:phosphoglycolate phosphatase